MGLLEKLPAPPAGKTGWPWTEESSLSLPNGLDREKLPKISIVTPSYNQGEFIEETIRSILLQNYPNLEYIIIDGGSDDNSVEIIKKYEPWLTFWVSEKDNGQSHAINKGFNIATGELLGWINSDDFLLKDALFTIGEGYLLYPDNIAWVGMCNFINKKGVFIMGDQTLIPNDTKSFIAFHDESYIAQPNCFFRKSAFLEAGMLNEELHYVMDVELWVKLSKIGTFRFLETYIAAARKYPEIKTYSNTPMRYVERLIVTWKEKEYDLARSQMIEFSKNLGRQNYLNGGFYNLMLLNLTWLYRKTSLKKLVNSIKSILGK